MLRVIGARDHLLNTFLRNHSVIEANLVDSVPPGKCQTSADRSSTALKTLPCKSDASHILLLPTCAVELTLHLYAYSHEADIKARLTRIEDILSTLITKLPASGVTSDIHSENSHGSSTQSNGNQASNNTHLHPQQAQQHHAQNQHGAYHQRPIAPAPPTVSARNRIRSSGSRTPVPISLDDAGNGYQRVDVDVRAMLSGGAGEEVFHPKAHESNSQVRSTAHLN
jgi:hypothetical protein